MGISRFTPHRYTSNKKPHREASRNTSIHLKFSPLPLIGQKVYLVRGLSGLFTEGGPLSSATGTPEEGRGRFCSSDSPPLPNRQ